MPGMGKISPFCVVCQERSKHFQTLLVVAIAFVCLPGYLPSLKKAHYSYACHDLKYKSNLTLLINRPSFFMSRLTVSKSFHIDDQSLLNIRPKVS